MYIFLMWMMLVAVVLANFCTTCEMGLLKFEKYHSLTRAFSEVVCLAVRHQDPRFI